MSKLYGIICSSGKQMYRLGRLEDGTTVNEPSWFTERGKLLDYFNPSSDKVVILDTDTLTITLEEFV